MPLFRKKPVIIEARQFIAETCAEVCAFIGIEHHDVGRCGLDSPLSIHTLEGVMVAAPGDWIIRGVQGEHYPCKPDIFEATYEPVSAGVSEICYACKAGRITGTVFLCPLHAQADTAIDLLRRLVEEYEYLDLSDTQMLRITIRGITDAARPLLAAIDGAPAPAPKADGWEAPDENAPAACPDCGCHEDDHRFGAAYQRLVAEDNGARRDGPNPCLICLNCGRGGE